MIESEDKEVKMKLKKDFEKPSLARSSPVHGNPPRRSKPQRDPYSPKHIFTAFFVLPGRILRPEEMFAVRFRLRGPNQNDRGVIMMAENKTALTNLAAESATDADGS